MKATHIIKGVLRSVLWIVLGVVLLASGILLTLYSSWGQRLLKDTLISKLNSQGETQYVLDDLRLRFPLDLQIAGLSMIQRGDTIVHADSLHADVKLLPLFAGNIDITKATLINGLYKMGAPDSAMCLSLRAGEVVLSPASVSLPSLDINLDDGALRHASVDITINPDTTAAPTDTTAAKTAMKIRLKHLAVDDLTYRMRMLPTIDSLGTNISHGALRYGEISLEAQTVKLHTFSADHLSAAYIAPDSATVAATPVVPTDPDAPASAPWTVTIDTLHLTQSEALYTTRGVVPQPGLDFAYIQASDLDLTITDFYNQATRLTLPLQLSATERCGLPLQATGTFEMDSAAMYFREFTIEAPETYLQADGLMGVGDLLTDALLPLRLDVNGYCGLSDMKMMFPGYAPYISMLRASSRADVTLSLDGTASRMALADMVISLPHCASLKAKGTLENVFQPDHLGADLALSGHIINVKSIIKAFTDGNTSIAVPPMVIDGRVKMHDAAMAANLTAKTLGGRLALDGRLNTSSEGYDLNLTTDKFPLHAFLPDMDLGNVTASMKAKGKGFNFLSQKTQMEASADIKSLIYNGYDYHGITMTADLSQGHAAIDASVDTNDLVASIEASGNLTGETYDWTATVDARSVDMEALKLSTTPMYVTASLNADATYTPSSGAITADIHLPGLYYKGADESEITLSDVDAKFSTDSLTRVSLHNRDLVAAATAYVSLDSLMARIDRTLAVIDAQIKDRRVDVDTLQKVLPPFRIDMSAGDDNLINDILRPSKMSINHLALDAANDSSLYLNSNILGYDSGSMTLDTIALGITQQAEKMHILGTVNNRPGNMDNWAHIRLDGQLALDRLSLRINQQDAAHKTGFDLGAIAVVADSSVTARFFPLSPIIGYKKWSVNLDNFVFYNFFTHHIDANLKMKGDDSLVQLYTDHDHTHGIEEHTDSINNVVLNISDVHLQDWISFNPFAPPISGNLSANMNVNWDGGQNINGSGSIKLEDFFYDRKKVSSFVADIDVSTSLAGTVRAQAALSVDGQRTMTLAGNLNDETTGSPFNLDFQMIHFPLSTVNPFLPEDMAQLSGTLNGAMQISGDSEHPKIDGEISFDSAFVKVAMTNTAYAISSVKIPVTDNVVDFENFSIMGANENPLYVNGTVDINSLTDPRIALDLKANNMMVVNTQKASRNALIYGKGYLDLKASVKGNMRFMAVNAQVDVLSGTNVTYILTESTADIADAATEGMVKFVNLNDTAAVVAADSLSTENMLLMLDAQLNIQQGTTVTVDLFTGKRDKVQIAPTGYLTYSLSPLASDGRMTGRINLNSGFVRYTLPVIGSEKMFEFDANSYVAFNGDMLNPVLNIHANDHTKVNVTQEGQNSRLVNFDIGVNVTGTLERMDVAFDLSTDDDLAVANELQAMTAQQRANQAMNMLLYNMYTGPGSSSNISLTANPLFSFLESQINNWAANNIKGVDLTFGIDQYNQTINGSTSSAMSYSYQVSKSLFNDRFKIVVGGNYTTDANADENLAENLVNDISFEYFLNKQQTMVLRLFRHVGYESILEGEIIQTGVGFVYRKKLDRLVNMLPKFIRPKEKRY